MSDKIVTQPIPFKVREALEPTALELKVNQYEWNAQEQRWIKLDDNAPDLPNTLMAGKFDGQIIKIPE